MQGLVFRLMSDLNSVIYTRREWKKSGCWMVCDSINKCCWMKSSSNSSVSHIIIDYLVKRLLSLV